MPASIRMSIQLINAQLNAKLNVLTILLLCLAPVSAASFTDKDQLKVDFSHTIEENIMSFSVKILNKSSKVITFVRHPGFYGISVYAAERKNDKFFGGFTLVTYGPVDPRFLVNIAPQESITFEKKYLVSDRGKNTYDIVEYSQLLSPNPYKKLKYVKVQGKDLQAIFRYGKYPHLLPKEEESLGNHYVMIDMKEKIEFQLP